ncbi:MAG: GTPase RsgA [Firmicutes bacterium]|nr:GTPase RsgA [Bacillota bacterium]
MSDKKCPGCGVVLQTEAPDQPGFYQSPEKTGTVYCQRCFRLRHYGQFKRAAGGETVLDREIQSALRKSDLILLVTDLFDPEGSMPVAWSRLFTLPVLVVVNKADLLPERTPWAEMAAWFQALWARRFPGAELLGVKVVSARQGGPERLARFNALKKELAGKKVTVLGAANVGKTSLLTSLLATEDQKRAELPTVSRFPGTTLGISTWTLSSSGLILYDTPGFLPGGRMGDRFAPETASRLLPEKKLQVKLWNIQPDGAVLVGGLAGIWNQSPAARTLVFFAGEKTPIHQSRGQKAEALLTEGPDWLRVYGQEERPERFAEQFFTVQPGEDLYISGCGWVAVKREAARIRLLVPPGVEVGTRPSLVGRREG